jgi:hypothetical protein
VSVFRRRGRTEGDAPGDARGSDDTVDMDGDDDSEQGASAGTGAPGPRANGPWDIAEVDDPSEAGRVSLGGAWIPGSPGLEVRVEADEATGAVVAVTLVLGDAALQVQPFAAPRSEGIWSEVRAEIRAGITAQGGTADEVDGPVGTELRTRVPVRRPDGSSGVEPARFLGVDGPRWFLRGVLTGEAAVDEQAAEPLLALFRDVVVVRGSDPMAPREPIPLRLPNEMSDGVDEGARRDDDPLNPFQRGPEITELH